MSTLGSAEKIVPCPNCGVNLSIPASLATPLVACPICQTHVAVTSSSPTDSHLAEITPARKPPKTMRYESMVLHGLLLLAATSVAGYAIQRAVGPSAAKAPPPAPVQVATTASPIRSFEEGDSAILTSRSRTEVFLALHEADWDEMTAALGRLDKSKLAKLIVQGKIISVLAGTRVTVVSPADRATKRLKVHVEEKESAGAEGWVELDWLRRERPKPLIARASAPRVAAKSADPASKDAVQVITEPEKPTVAPADPQAEYASGAAFDHSPLGMQTKYSRGSFQNPVHGPTQGRSPAPRRPPGMAPRGTAPNLPDPSFENPRSEAPPRPGMPAEKNQPPE